LYEAYTFAAKQIYGRYYIHFKSLKGVRRILESYSTGFKDKL
jgi:hypothetical protein